MNEKQQAINILNDIIAIPRLGGELVSKCKLDLGDIYLLQDDPWEASLLYSQVEKANKDSPVAYEAKLRNAKLNYYTGYFSLALSHLNILKKATTREISNDAISLSLLINNNTILDTSDFIMQKFANIELMVFQNQDSLALNSLNQLISETPHHTIVDECLWLKAIILRKAGRFELAINSLNQLLASFSYDILADDAAFTKAEIIERNLKQPDESKDLYREFLTSYPGSMFAAEARKRFRSLRGDQLN
ncbi:MAG: tetratricopeptide repeat protein [Bacteroidota bacterium]